MLATLRGGLNKWYARLFFGFLVLLFIAWGVGSDLLRLISGTSDLSAAHVGERTIEMPELQDAYRRQLAQVSQQLGGQDPSPEIRQAVLQQVLNRLITQSAMIQTAASTGLIAPEDAQRAAVYALPAFRGSDGKFDRNVFETVLRNNNLTEARFLALISQDLLDRQFSEPLRAGVAAPDVLTHEIYAFQHERRTAQAVTLPFADAAEPAAPTDLELARWYENHKAELYSTPEMRRIKVVVLSPDTLAKDVDVTDQDLQGAWEQVKSSMSTPEQRAAEVVMLSDEAKAATLVKFWQDHAADWNAVKDEATRQGGSPIDLPASGQAQIPSPELGAAMFAAAPDAVGGPVKTPLGWYAFRVTTVTPGTTKTFEQARPELEKQVIAEKATDLIYDRANKIDDMLSGGVALDALPGDLGLAAASGTLDAEGNTAEGKPAPLPGDEAVRAAVLAAVFAAKPGEPPHLNPVGANGSGGYFAFTVDDILPPAPRPQAEVAQQVRADWLDDARHHAQEQAAAAIMTAVKSGQTLAAAAGGRAVAALSPVSRAAPAEDVPPQLVAPLFGLKTGEATMVETQIGFVVAVLTAIDEPDPNADPIGFGQIRDALSRSMANDVDLTLANAVRDRMAPRINQSQVGSLIHQAD